MVNKSSSRFPCIDIPFYRYPREKSIINDFLKNRRRGFAPEILNIVNSIIERVRLEGDRALFELTKMYDLFELSPETLEITESELKEAYEKIDSGLQDALKVAIKRIEDFHQRFLPETKIYEDSLGNLLGQVVRPVERAGIYIPGGRANYPSTAIMNIVPAKVAGVSEIYVCVPPDSKGKISNATLAALYLLKPTRVFRVGGAQAIAALAYGTESIPAVDVIAGPGNIYVAAAKKLVSGDVGIDMVAGPSEVVVIADAGSNPAWVARDLLAQAEHDPDASAMLISNSRQLLEEVKHYLVEFGATSERSHIIGEALKNNCIFFLADSIESGIELANQIAPEHLELEVEDPFNYIHLIRSAGAVFLGKYTAESFGDYILGPNHTLPTQATARFASPLSAATFMKFFNIAMVSKKAVAELYPHLEKIAAAEGLREHARAAQERYRKLKQQK